MPRCLVFGSEGFVGPYLARELEAHGWEVVGSDRAERALKSGLAEYRRCDISSDADVRSLVGDLAPDAVVNLAAISSVSASWRDPLSTLEVNVKGPVRILEAIRESRPDAAVLLVGSGEAYAPSLEPHVETDPLDASNPYGISKAAQDNLASLYADRYGMRVLRARPFNHTGVGQADAFVVPSWCRQAAEISLGLRKPVMRVGNLDVERDFSDVRDVVRAYRLILECGGAGCVYNVGSGRCLPLREILADIIALTGKNVSVESDPSLYRPADNPRSACDARAISLDLGWEPAIPVETSSADLFNSFVEEEGQLV